MQPTGFLVNINSHQPEKMIAFYRDIVGLPRNPDVGEGGFHAGPITFIIDSHSEVNGPAREPARVLLNFFVDDLASAQKELEGKGIKFIRTAGKEEWGGVISTFTDPDGNYCQLIEYKPQ